MLVIIHQNFINLLVDFLLDLDMHKFLVGKETDEVIISKLSWGKQVDSFMYQKFDDIIISDCLYYEKHHSSLLHTLESLVRPGGMVHIVAPPRGKSLER